MDFSGKILSTAIYRPEFEYSTEEIIAYLSKTWFQEIPAETARLAKRIMENSDIDRRAAPFPIEKVFAPLTFEEKNDLYIKAAISLSEKALKRALDKAQLKATEIDYIITTSCTGFMIPSVDAYLVESLGMRTDIRRLPVTEMGCAGGTSALIYAQDILRSRPDFKVAIVAVEIPSITFQPKDLSMENLVSTAIFADGAAAVILGATDRLAPTLVDSQMYHFPKSTHLMGYHLRNSGLKIVLDREVPDAIQENFQSIFFPFLEKNGLKPEQIRHYMFHPGGKKIIAKVEDFIGRYGKDISESRGVLRDYGNMSSATILHILDRKLQQSAEAGDYGYMLAFGPGFSAQSVLLRWQ